MPKLLRRSLVAGMTSAQVAFLMGTTPPRMTAWDTGTHVYLRMDFDETNDLVVKFIRSASASVVNMNYLELGRLAKTTASGGSPTLTSVASFIDETTGYLTGANGRFGGNHLAEILQINKTGHGLTGSSIGKRYRDTNNDEYAITNIIDANTLWLIQKPKTLVGDATGTKYLPPTPSILTGLDGLSNLASGDWTCGYTAAGPGCNGLKQQFLIDGRELVPFSPPVSCDKFQIVEYTEAPNLSGGFTYFTTTGASATWAQAGKMWRRITTTTWHPWREMEVEDAFVTEVAKRFNETLPVQFNPPLGISPATHRHFWVPGAGPITATGSTLNGVANPVIDLNVPTFFGGTCSGSDVQLEGTTNSLLSGGAFPDIVIQLCAPASNTHANWTFAHVAFLDPTYANGIPSLRDDNTKEWMRIQLSSATLKCYPFGGVSADSERASGLVHICRAARQWLAPLPGPIDFWTVLKLGSKWYVIAAWTTNPGTFTLTLPGWLRGKTASVVRAFRSSMSDAYSTPTGEITLTASAANGHAVIAIEP